MATGAAQSDIWELRLDATPSVGIELYSLVVSGTIATASLDTPVLVAKRDSVAGSGGGGATTIAPMRVHPGMAALSSEVTHRFATTGWGGHSGTTEIFAAEVLPLALASELGARAVAFDFESDPHVITGADDALTCNLNGVNFTNAPTLEVRAHFGVTASIC